MVYMFNILKWNNRFKILDFHGSESYQYITELIRHYQHFHRWKEWYIHDLHPTKLVFNSLLDTQHFLKPVTTNYVEMSLQAALFPCPNSASDGLIFPMVSVSKHLPGSSYYPHRWHSWSLNHALTTTSNIPKACNSGEMSASQYEC